MVTRLLWSIKSKIQNSPWIFALFIVGQAVSLLCGMFVYGLVAANKDLNDRYSGIYNTAVVNKAEDNGFGKRFYNALESRGFLGGVRRMYMEESVKSDRLIPVVAGRDSVVNGSVPAFLTLRFLLVSDSSSAAEITLGGLPSAQDLTEKAAKAAIYYNAFATPVKLDDVVSVDGKEFTIVGLTNTEVMELPYGALELPADGQTLTVIFSRAMSNDDREQLRAAAREASPQAEVNFPQSHGGFFAQNKTTILTAALVLALALLNISYLYSYLLNKNRMQYTVFTLCGSSRKGIFFHVLIELLLYAAIVSMVCTLFNQTLLRDVYIHMQREITYHMGLADCAAVCLSYYGCIGFVFFRMIYRFSRQTVIQIYRHN